MNYNLKHYGTFELTESGPKFKPDDAQFFRLNCEGLVGKRVEIDISEEKRSNQANRYYFGVVVKTFVQHFNSENTFSRTVDSEWVHELLAAHALGFTRQVLPWGEILEMRNRSSSLTVSEFTQFIENTKAWGSEFFGLKFPEPIIQDDDTSR